MIVRPERAGDEAVIGAMTQAAFRDMPYSDQTEHLIIERLRRAGMLSVSIVAEAEGEIIGYAGFSPVSVDGGNIGWYGLGPVSVSPERQRSGIGSAMINEGLFIIKGLGGRGCAVAGDPAYYKRFGFNHNEGLKAEGVPDKHFMILPLQGGTPSGIVRYHPAFFGDIE